MSRGREDWVMQHMGFSNWDLGVAILTSTLPLKPRCQVGDWNLGIAYIKHQHFPSNQDLILGTCTISNTHY
jgi:hypothetical protein